MSVILYCSKTIAQAASRAYDVRDRDPLHFGWCMYTCMGYMKRKAYIVSVITICLFTKARMDLPLCIHVMQTNTIDRVCLHNMYAYNIAYC